MSWVKMNISRFSRYVYALRTFCLLRDCRWNLDFKHTLITNLLKKNPVVRNVRSINFIQKAILQLACHANFVVPLKNCLIQVASYDETYKVGSLILILHISLIRHDMIYLRYGSFTLLEIDSDTDSDSDSKPNGYTVLCRTCSDSDSHPYSLLPKTKSNSHCY